MFKKWCLTIVAALCIIGGPMADHADAGRKFGGGGSTGVKRPSGGGASNSRPAPRPSPAPAPRPNPAPRPQPTPPSNPKPSNPTPPAPKPRSGYDGGAAAAARKQESQAAMRKSSSYQPKSSYRTASGQERNIDSSNPRVSRMRDNYSYDRYETRTTRYTTVFGPNYSTYGGFGGGIVYSDPISPFFYGWMMSNAMNSQQRAMWVYNHRDELDDARYREMCAKDALLDAKIKELEAAQTARDPNYTPDGVDSDLQYSDEYIRAVANVDAAEQDVRDAQARTARYSGGAGSVKSLGITFWGFCKFIIGLVVLAVTIWVVASVVMYFTQRND